MVAAMVAKGSADAFVKSAAAIRSGQTAAEIASQAGANFESLAISINQTELAIEKQYRDLEKQADRDRRNLEKKIAALNSTSKAYAEDVYARISQQTGTSVQTLKEMKASSGLGFGDLLMATEMVNATGKSF